MLIPVLSLVYLAPLKAYEDKTVYEKMRQEQEELMKERQEQKQMEFQKRKDERIQKLQERRQCVLNAKDPTELKNCFIGW